MVSRRAAAWLAALAVAFVSLGLLFCAYLVTWDDEWSYLTIGRLALVGRIGLFQDEILGERLPLPYYVIGFSQLVAGPSLLTARLTSLGLGVLALAFTFLAARAIAGNAAGLLAAAFLATHGFLLGYYAAASYYGLCAALVAAGVAALVGLSRPAGSLVCMACFTAVAFSRANLAVMAPLVLVYLLATADTLRERLALLAVCAVPPLIFFLWSVDHLKILAYVPGLGSLVAPLGYRSVFALGSEAVWVDRAPGENLIWFAKRHAAWIAATLMLVMGTVLQRLRGDRRGWPALVGPVAVLALYTLAWQALILKHYLKSVAAFAAAFAPLWAIVLGYGAAALLEAPGPRGRLIRAATATACAVILLLSPTFSRHAAMPRPLPHEGTTVDVFTGAASAILAVVPPDERVFVFGNPVPAYLAGARMYLQQTFHYSMLVPSADAYAVSRSGVWGERELERWLSSDARYAIVEPAIIEHFRTVRAYAPLMARLETLLTRHFVHVTTVGGAAGVPRQVLYARAEQRTVGSARHGELGLGATEPTPAAQKPRRRSPHVEGRR